MRAISFKDKRTIGIALGIPLLFFAIGIVLGDYVEWYQVDRKEAAVQLNELLSNYIGLLGLGFAILAILFAIIQLAYKQLSIIQILIDSSYFLPVFYFGMTNIFCCAILTTFQYSGTPFSDHFFVRLVVIEGYLFWLLMPGIIIVFIKTVQLTDFSRISEIYLRKIYRMAVTEKQGKTTDKFREQLQLFGLEVRSEMSILTEQNKIIQLGKFFNFYIRILKLNPNSNLLKGLHTSMKNWFVKSYKIADKDVFRTLISSWWNYFSECLKTGAIQQAALSANIPLDLYNDYRKTKDRDLADIAMTVFPIRQKEFALIQVYEMLKERKNYDEYHKKIATSLEVFPDLLKAAIDERDDKSVRSVFVQLRLLLQTLESEKQALANTKYAAPALYTAEDEALKTAIEQNIVLIYQILLNAYGWFTYKIFEDE